SRELRVAHSPGSTLDLSLHVFSLPSCAGRVGGINQALVPPVLGRWLDRSIQYRRQTVPPLRSESGLDWCDSISGVSPESLWSALVRRDRTKIEFAGNPNAD